jgi:hypothetical protein
MVVLSVGVAHLVRRRFAAYTGFSDGSASLGPPRPVKLYRRSLKESQCAMPMV